VFTQASFFRGGLRRFNVDMAATETSPLLKPWGARRVRRSAQLRSLSDGLLRSENGIDDGRKTPDEEAVEARDSGEGQEPDNPKTAPSSAP
jgi:hypothetical protein